jgi:spore germination cell wall hydrolase CwlJ-like protein
VEEAVITTPITTAALYTPAARRIAALTIWGEARGEDRVGQIAVAWVIRMRAEHPGRDWWGDSVADVCLKASKSGIHQFSCWAHDDPNRAKMVGLYDSELEPFLGVADAVFTGGASDPTFGATHYHTLGIYPAWASGRAPTTVIGRHVFYALGPGA